MAEHQDFQTDGEYSIALQWDSKELTFPTSFPKIVTSVVC